MTADDGRSRFVSPYVRTVRCFGYGDGVAPADASGVDVSGPEYAPRLEPVCPDGTEERGLPGVPCC